jgi:hypothetical protein
MVSSNECSLRLDKCLASPSVSRVYSTPLIDGAITKRLGNKIFNSEPTIYLVEHEANPKSLNQEEGPQ